MTKTRTLLAISAAASLLVGLGAGSASALVEAGAQAQEQSRTDQGEARREMRAGNQLSLRQIERRILPSMRGSEYLGPSYDSTARAYRLKFIKNGRVTYVDVDARTGRIIGRSN
ncbi:MAG: PepSY domain-containing protein [Erythrobacter sp.]